MLFVSADAIEDYEGGAAPVLVTHRNCLASGLEPLENFQCDAECFLLQTCCRHSEPSEALAI